MNQPATIVRTITMTTAADDLHIGRNQLFKLLREHGHFIDNTPKPHLIKAGYFQVEIHQWHNPNNDRIARQYAIPMVTGAGLAWLREFLHGIGHQPKAATPRRRNLHRPTPPVAGTDRQDPATRVARAG